MRIEHPVTIVTDHACYQVISEWKRNTHSSLIHILADSMFQISCMCEHNYLSDYLYLSIVCCHLRTCRCLGHFLSFVYFHLKFHFIPLSRFIMSPSVWCVSMRSFCLLFHIWKCFHPVHFTLLIRYSTDFLLSHSFFPRFVGDNKQNINTKRFGFLLISSFIVFLWFTSIPISECEQTKWNWKERKKIRRN